MNDNERIELAAQCTDCDDVPKVPAAGTLVRHADGDYQIMHNGIKARVDTHYGAYNVEVIRRLRGHHEPQEEHVFHEVVKTIRPGGVMIELGSFWAYYSLWFLHAVARGRAVMVEPLEESLNAGRRNFDLNGKDGSFIHAAVSDSVIAPAPVELWPGMTTTVRRVNVDTLMAEAGLDTIDVLHADIQGAEVKMLQGASRALHARKIRWIFISTHGENIHQRCLELLRRCGYSIVAGHTPGESYSVDGLIVASAAPEAERIRVSKRRTFASAKAKFRAALRVRILEPFGIRPATV